MKKIQKDFLKIFLIINLIGTSFNGFLFYFDLPNGLTFFIKSNYYIQGISIILYIIFSILLYKIITTKQIISEQEKIS
ncbi:hypothetical protein CNZW441b_b0038 (plasmid) [Campylobacter novaezeelandiae]|uniref:Uncharacterized protein n=1 Tax=Campylobacter novaezeelandiae TaxID=2267891 RepID=A0A4Q9JTI4_9BACT|nr:hypothetical protein [Campylobacter novaezeelandiae]QWU80883.1 hypothetical protein CNZW441b_b0038 [Campylobacter novaezeelandiae]TBR79537.1 hypothetical protein DU473_07025 [Campylobacter novaezeelandiae]